MKIAAVVLHYRHWPGVRPTLDALLAQTRRPDQLIVVEHASGDDSAQHIRSAYPEAEVIAVEENRGQIAGNNHALRAGLDRGFDAMLLLCDDSLLAPDAIERLAERMEERPSLGAVGPLVAYPGPDGQTMIHHGGYIDQRTWHLLFTAEPGEVSDWTGRPPHSVDWVEGGVILFRAEAVRQAGFLDEALYYRIGEAEYTLRMRGLGWELECVPSAVARQQLAHVHVYLHTRNHLRVIQRHAPRRFLVREVVRLGYLVARDVLDPRRRADHETWSRLRGLMNFVSGRWGPPPEGTARA